MKLDPIYPAALCAVALLYAVNAHATGNGPPAVTPPSHVTNDIHPSASVNATVNAAAAAIAGGGTGGAGGAGGAGGPVSTSVSNTTEVKQRAFGGGSTGLTGSARCLQSFGFAFNALSATYTDKNCLAMEVAEEHCDDRACRKAVACANPDVPDYAKAAIGCK